MTTEKISILRTIDTVPLGGTPNNIFQDKSHEMFRDGNIIHVLHRESGESFTFHVSRAVWWKPFYKPLTKEQLAKPEKEVGEKEVKK